MQGVCLYRISAALGHGNFDITRWYASFKAQKLLNVVDGLGQTKNPREKPSDY